MISATPGHIVVSQIGDSERFASLVEALVSAGFDVIEDREDEGLPGPFAGGFIRQKAAALVLALGPGAVIDVDSYDVRGRAAAGSIVPVLLDGSAQWNAPWHLNPVDLRCWPGDGSEELERLITSLRGLVVGSRPRPGMPPVVDADSVRWATSALNDLRALVGELGRIGEILAGDVRQGVELCEALDEVGETYRAVTEALSDFAAAGDLDSPAERRQIHAVARSNLSDRIHNRRGSCRRIGVIYLRSGGLREALEARTDGDTLAQADQTFYRLSESDFNLFDQMERLGESLSSEARAVENLLVAGQREAAQRRLQEGWSRLEPLERALAQARAELQRIQTRLGYAERVATAEGVVTVSIVRQTIHGDVVNSNVVAAQTIKDSELNVSAAPISPDLKEKLGALHAEVAKLTAAMPDDDAALAAQDLKQLADEAISPRPRKSFWKRSVDGLVDAATRFAAVGTPVIQLAHEIADLLERMSA